MIIYILMIVIYIYINDIVCKCNRLDKCGYHYTPRQYFEDNPWLKEDECPSIHYHRKNGWMDSGQTPPPPPRGYIPEWVFPFGAMSLVLQIAAYHNKFLVRSREMWYIIKETATG